MKKFLVKQLLWFCNFFISWRFLRKKPTTFKTMPLRFFINSSKYVHFWTLVLKTILILIKFPFQQYVNCRRLNFDPTYENGRHGDFPRFWKSGILGLVDHFVVCTKIFLDHKRTWNKNFLWTQKFLRNSITGLGLYRDY